VGQAAAGVGDGPTGVALSARGLTAVAALVLLAAPAAEQEPCRVIVNPANPATQIQRTALVAIYLGNMKRWNDGKTVLPVDQSTRSPLRAAFSERVLGKSLMSVQTHWLRKMAEDRVPPPPVKASDAEVTAYVRANAGAIGYVSNEFKLDDTVKVVKVIDAPAGH
jgi:ABC-type phosphate transport system substrate-binding protein